MNRRTLLASLGGASVIGTAGCSANRSDQPNFRVRGDGFERLRDGEYEAVTLRGVNLGMAKPGYFPGEAAITRPEYDRWLSAIGEIANVVRTYTIHPPAFYRALQAYNDSATQPLLLLQGTWVPTAELVEAGDATVVSGTVDTELQRTVDVIHGKITLPERPGHAAGTYDADVSDSTVGLLFGIEWPPEVVAETNDTDIEQYKGQYFQTHEATPFEQWLAGRLDTMVGHEMEKYNTQRPVSFVNWVTTDPLPHPYEPFANEDGVSIDPDSIKTTEVFTAGTVASYHVYPYYPDFLNETPEYVQYTDHRGEPNNYAGYLNDLIDDTEQPVLIAEFGVPSSRGIAHRNVHGRDQGRHTEQEQGEIAAAMFEDIDRAGTAGGVVFTWQSEWFKRTWNLDARSVPSRRPYWSNIETPEQQFGLLSFDPADGISLDGSERDWDGADKIMPDGTTQSESLYTLASLQVTHDVEGISFRVEFEELPDPVDWTQMNVLLPIGMTGRTNELPFGVTASATADFLVRLAGPDDSRLLVDSRYDAFAREFGADADLPLEAYRDGTANFVPVREPVNRGYTVPPTGEEVPFDAVETGALRYGNGNPDSELYDSLTDVHVDPEGNAVEVRLPWILLNIADPSSKQRIASDWEEGLATVSFESISVSAATFNPESSQTGQITSRDELVNLSHQIPSLDGSTIESAEYTWETWDQPAYKERLKESYHILANTVYRTGEHPDSKAVNE